MSQGIQDIQEIKSRLSAIGHTNIDENVIGELLESFGPNYDLNDVIGIISGSLDNFGGRGEVAINAPGPSHTGNNHPEPPDGLRILKTDGDQTDKCKKGSDVIYVSSDETEELEGIYERHEREFGEEEEEDDEDADDEDEEDVNDYYLCNGTSEEESDTEIQSKPTSPPLINTLHNNGVSPFEPVLMEILEENNNDPNNNLDATQILQETDNNLATRIQNEQPVIEVETNSIPTDTDIPGPSDNNKRTRARTPDASKLLEETQLIKSVLPKLDSLVIHTALFVNLNAKNRIELTLWDLLPKKRPIPQLINKRKSPNQISCLKPKKPCKISTCVHVENDTKDIVECKIVSKNASNAVEENEIESMNNFETLEEHMQDEEQMQETEVQNYDNNKQTVDEPMITSNTNNSSVNVVPKEDGIQRPITVQENDKIIHEERLNETEDVIENNDIIIGNNSKENFRSLNEVPKDVEMQDTLAPQDSAKTANFLVVKTNPTVRQIGTKVLIQYQNPGSSFSTRQNHDEIPNNAKIIRVISSQNSSPQIRKKVPLNYQEILPKPSTSSRLVESVSIASKQNIEDRNVASNIEDEDISKNLEHKNPLIRPPKLILSPKSVQLQEGKVKSIVAPARFIVGNVTNGIFEPQPGPSNRETFFINHDIACSIDPKLNKKTKEPTNSKIALLTEEQIVDRCLINMQKKYDRLEKFGNAMKMAKNKDPQTPKKSYDSPICLKMKPAPSPNQNEVVRVDLNQALPIPENAETIEKEIDYDKPMYYKLSAMFPNIDSTFIKSVCVGDANSKNPTDESVRLNHAIDNLIHQGNKYPRVNFKPEPKTEDIYDLHEQYDNLLGIFPNAEPGYLRKIAETIYNKPEEMKKFVQSKLERPDYPTREEFLARKKVTDQQKQYTTDFTVGQFLEIFPDPITYFEKQKRKSVFIGIALDFLKHHFNRLKVATLLRVYTDNQFSLTPTVKELQTIPPDMKSKRMYPFHLNTEDIPLLQEIAYITHKDEILSHFQEQKRLEDEEFRQHKDAHALLECECCYDNECVPKKCSTCDDGHVFCHACIVRGTEAKLSDGQSHIRCFVDCQSEFSLAVLQKVLKPTQFSILLKKRQEKEIMTAGLEGLISCPFCHFASIPPPEDKVFACLNPECMKQSCRFCRKPNHVPMTCDEVDAEKVRHVLEEKMTEALIRNCYKCNMPFFKEEGCNKMTCVCGALMCYLCDKPVKDYSHFNPQGGSNTQLCPLFSDDRHLNAIAVRKIAEETEKQIKLKNPNIKLDTKNLLPALPAQSRGAHSAINNANALPSRIHRIAGTIPQ